MHKKQLFKLTIFSSLLITTIAGNISIAGDTTKISADAKTAQQHSGVFTGELIETFNSGGYTYIHLNTEKEKVWAAGPVTDINKSDKVSFIGKVAMIDFYSKSLKRKFETIYFVDAYIINGVKSGQTAIDPHKKINKQPVAELKSFEKVKGGLNINEIISNKDSLENKTVKVRGQVSKYTANVMGKNWLHIRDSSSDQDITITTDASVQLNDIIIAEGQLILNKNFGYGYVYQVLIEDAKLDIEQ